MAAFVLSQETCPCCSSKGNCIIHGYYHRSIVDFQDDKPTTALLRVLRVKCTSCGHTHAVLPDFIVPYLSYGIRFILQVLAEFFSHVMTVAALCAKYAINPRVLYRWIRTFYSHKELIISRIDLSATPDHSFVQGILSAEYSPFSMQFILKTSFSFLQSHRNPLHETAPYHQVVFTPDYEIS